MSVNNRGMNGRPSIFHVGIMLLAVSAAQADQPICSTVDSNITYVNLQCTDIVNLSTVIEAVALSGKILNKLAILDSPQLELRKEDFENTDLLQLRELEFRHCGLETFTSEPIRGLINLRSLSLNSNNLTVIGADTFQGLSGLNTLKLYNNEISTIDSSALKPLTNLTTLDLSYNKLTAITPGLFQGTSLSVLNLRNNLLTTINEGDFSGADTLLNLELEFNEIKTIHSLAFRNLRVLNYLDLRYNILEGLDSRLFETNPIIVLDLQGNNIDNLANFPLNISALRALNLANTNIQNIPTDYFSNLPNLLLVALNDNNITYLQPGLFSGNRNIMQLFLDDNALTSLNIKSFEQLYEISNRKQSDLDEEAISGFPGSKNASPKTVVELSDNPWDCTTQEMIELKAWIEQSGSTFEHIFTCHTENDETL